MDLTKGPILKSVLLYSIPIMLASLIQNLFNSADIMVVGNLGSSLAVAAVGATGPIVSLLVNTFVGLSAGTNILLARFVGSKDSKNIHKTVDTSIISSFAIGIIVAIVGMICAGLFLEITDCPADCFESAKLYLMIYFCASPAIMVYNFGAAVIRVNGDSQRPLYYMIFSGLLNVILNLILCLILEEKVVAVAVATLASQLLGAILVILHLIKINGDCRISFKNLIFSWPIFRKIFYYGAPCAFNSSLYSISNLQIQSAINSYGTSAIAGNIATCSIEGIVASFTGSFAVASVAFIGQNVGAGDRERVKKSFFTCLLTGITVGLTLGVLFTIFGRQLLSLYITDDLLAIEYGRIRMNYVLLFYGVAAATGVLTSTIQAFGYSIIPMFTSIVTILLFRVFWMFVIYPRNEIIENLFLCYTISWITSVICHSITLSVLMSKYFKGKNFSI